MEGPRSCIAQSIVGDLAEASQDLTGDGMISCIDIVTDMVGNEITEWKRTGWNSRRVRNREGKSNASRRKVGNK